MKITEDVRNYAAERGLTDVEATESGKQECRKRRKHSQRRVPRFTQRRNSIASAVSAEKILGDAMPVLSEVERALSRRKPI